MRGTHHAQMNARTIAGIIPAYAGNTYGRTYLALPEGDHPRVCGEHASRLNAGHHARGSSPRMRGTLPLQSNPAKDGGIIPAYAGNTRIYITSCVVVWDHPRVCGEHLRSAGPAIDSRGSSPRMRGTHDVPSSCTVGTGIIPAYAGNTHQ